MAQPRRDPHITESVRDMPLAGATLRYTLRETPRARGMRATIHPTRGLVVSVPAATRRGWADPVPTVERFLREREAWVRRHLRRAEAAREALDSRPALGAGRKIPYLGQPHEVRAIPASPTLLRSQVIEATGALEVLLAPRDRRSLEDVLATFFRDRAREAIDAAIRRHASALRCTPGAITLRDPRTRWGSCSRGGRLSFSWRLILAPPAVLESVVVHELCHLRVFGHGPRFRHLLASRVPDHVAYRRWLREHAVTLHTALDPTPATTAAA